MALINIKQYAEKNNLSRQRIFQLIQAGRLKSATKIDGVWFVDEDDEIVKVVRKPYVPPKKDEQVEKQRTLYKDSFFRGLVTIELYAKLHETTVPCVRNMIKDGCLKTAVKICGMWFIDPDDCQTNGATEESNDIDFSKNDDISFLDNFVTVEQYADFHGVTAASVRKKIHQKQLKSILTVGNRYFIDKNEPLIDNRIKSGRYVNNQVKDIADIGDFVFEKYGINDLSGVIVALLSDEDFLKTKRTKKSQHFIDSWCMQEEEFESLQDSLFQALHPDNAKAKKKRSTKRKKKNESQ